MFQEIEQLTSVLIRDLDAYMRQQGEKPVYQDTSNPVYDTFLNSIWPQFDDILSRCGQEIRRRTQLGHPLQTRFPSQELMNQLQTLNERLTQFWYGTPNINRMYHFMLEANTFGGLICYQPKDYLNTGIRSRDGKITVYDTNYRESKELRQLFADKKLLSQRSHGALNMPHGKNPLEKLFAPYILTKEQSQHLSAKRGVLKATQKFLKKPLRKIDHKQAEAILAQVQQAPTAETQAQAMAIHHQNNPGQSFISPETDRELLKEGVQSGQLVIKRGHHMQNLMPDRYLRFNFVRALDFQYLSDDGVKTARPAGTMEYHRSMTNHMPYFEDHGLVIAGTGHRIQDPCAFQSNLRMDVEKTHRMLFFFNPPADATPLPGEGFLSTFQNPRVSASIEGTEHNHLAMLDPSSFALFDFDVVYEHTAEETQYQLFQGGSCPDSVILDISYQKPEKAPLSFIYNAMLELRAQYAKEANELNAVDISFVCFKKGDRYHTLMIPMCNLTQNKSNETIINVRGEVDKELGLPLYHSLPHPMLGAYRLRFDNDTEHKLAEEGVGAIRRFHDFVAVDGMKSRLIDTLNKHLAPASRPGLTT